MNFYCILYKMFLKWLIDGEGKRVKSETFTSLIEEADTPDTLVEKINQKQWNYCDFYLTLHECCEYEILKYKMKHV